MARSLLRLGLMSLALLAGLCLGCAIYAQGAAAPTQPRTDAPSKPDKPVEAEEPADLVELFKPLPDDKLPSPVTPSRQFKTAVLNIPNPESWNDNGVDDLSGDERAFAIGLLQGLEHRVYHSPHLYFDYGPEAQRGKRAPARLRFSDNPPLDKPAPANLIFAGPEKCCTVLNADILLLARFVPGKDEKASRAHLWRYRRGKGVEYTRHVEVPALGTPESNSALVLIHKLAEEACTGVLAAAEEAKFHPVPPMASKDETLMRLAEIQDALAQGDPTGVWITYSALSKADPSCTRVARAAMLAFRVLNSRESDIKSIRAGIEAILADPFEAELRAYVALEAWLVFGLKSKLAVTWARRVGAQALRIEPANVFIINAYADVTYGRYSVEQVRYYESEGLKACADGRIQLLLGTACFNRRGFEDAIRWYQQARKLMPDDHESAVSLGLVCTHAAEDLMNRALPGEHGEERRTRAAELYDIGSAAFDDAVRIDPSEMGMIFDFYVRCATRSFRVLPSDPTRLKTLFMVQACRNGLLDARNPADDNARFNALCGEVLLSQRVLTRMNVREAKPGQADYELALTARVQLDSIDREFAGAVEAVRQLRRIGNRGPIFIAGMGQYGALVEAAEGK